MIGKLQKNNKGFTIIEVLIVLAIAGLIMLIVFLAVPALQRNQRNTSRRNDVGRVGSVATEFITNNNGAMPTTAAHATTIATSAGALSQYTGTAYLLFAAGAGTPITNLAQMRLVTGVVCDPATPGGVTNAAGAGATGRSMAIQYAVERAGGSTPVCQNV